MITKTELETLILDIEKGPVTRDLEDRVLEACKVRWALIGTSPLTNLHDAQLAVPEGYHLLSIWFTDSDDFRASVMRDDWRQREPGTSTVFSAEGAQTKGQPKPARALVLAGMKARLAELEAK